MALPPVLPTLFPVHEARHQADVVAQVPQFTLSVAFCHPPRAQSVLLSPLRSAQGGRQTSAVAVPALSMA